MGAAATEPCRLLTRLQAIKQISKHVLNMINLPGEPGSSTLAGSQVLKSMFKGDLLQLLK